MNEIMQHALYFWIALFTYFEIYFVVCINIMLLFYCWEVVYCMNILQFVHLLLSYPWAFHFFILSLMIMWSNFNYDYLFLIYRNKVDFCRFILYPEIFLNSLIKPSFLVESLWLLERWLYYLHTKTVISSFLVCVPFTFSCLIALSGTSSMMLNRSSENRHLFFVPGFWCKNDFN